MLVDDLGYGSLGSYRAEGIKKIRHHGKAAKINGNGIVSKIEINQPH
jgi:hypothetical protein